MTGELRVARVVGASYTGSTMKAARPLLLSLCLLPALACAQWQWVDKDGRRVFSDQPPPADVPTSKILRQPGARAPQAASTTPATTPAAPTAAAATAAAPASQSAAAPKVSGQDKALLEKKKQAEAAEAAKRKEEEEKIAAARADNCERSRSAKASFDSGLRIVRTNEKGEREFLDDKQRAAEVQRLEGLIARDCR